MAVKPNEIYVLEMSEEQWDRCGEIEEAIDRKLLHVERPPLFTDTGNLNPVIVSLDELGEDLSDITGTMWREITRRYAAQGWNAMPTKRKGFFLVLQYAGKRTDDIEWIGRITTANGN